MKTRMGFVANSSSSSFIIGCSEVPKNLDDAAEIWFGSTKEFVAPVIIQGLFEDLKTITIDYDLLLENAKTKKWKDIFYNKAGNDYTAELLTEIVSEFEYTEKYHYDDDCMWYSRNDPKPFDIFKKAEEAKLCKKYDVKTIYDTKIPFTVRFKLEGKWFTKKEVRERFVKYVEHYIVNLKRYPVLMTGEFADDYELGSELEHGSHWEKFPYYIRFSHH